MIMTIEQKENTRKELERMKSLLDDLGIDYDVSFPAYLYFSNANGECMVFPSQTHDDKLVIVYPVKKWCDTAEDVLIACGVMEEQK